MPANALPPLQLLSPDDHGAIVVVVAYCFAGFTLVAAAARVSITIRQKQGFHRDDVAFLVAAMCATVSSILYERAVDGGLGRHIDRVATSTLRRYYAFAYAASLTGIIAMAGGKLAVLGLYERLAPRQDARGISILAGSIAIWTTFALLAQAFQCGATVVYKPDQCSTHGYLQFPSIILNIITDGLLALWMAPTIWKLQTTRNNRIIPITLFALRFVVCFLAIGQLVVYAYNFHRIDQTWASVVPSAMTIVVVHLSVLTATLPRINSFLADIKSGQIGLQIADRDIELMSKSQSGGNSGNLSSNQSGKRSANHSANASGKQNSGARMNRTRPQGPEIELRSDKHKQAQQISRATYGRGSDASESGDGVEHDVDNNETGSQSSLKGNAVYQRTEFRFEVKYTDQAGPSRPVR